MIAIINFAVMILSTILFSVLYSMSVQPAKLEKTKGPQAYKICGKIRKISFIFVVLLFITYVLFYFFPLQTFLPRFFLWGWVPSIIIGSMMVLIATILIYKAGKAAADESFTPNKENSMYSGIYKKIRHPQAISDTVYYIATGFLINSPFIVFISLFWIPIYWYICKIEEDDLVIRFGESYQEYIKTTGMFIPKSNKYKELGKLYEQTN